MDSVRGSLAREATAAAAALGLPLGNRGAAQQGYSPHPPPKASGSTD